MTSGTFEECLDDIMIEKAELPNLATSAEDWSTNYSHDNLAEIEQDSFEECIGIPCFGNDLAKPVLRLAKQFSTMTHWVLYPKSIACFSMLLIANQEAATRKAEKMTKQALAVQGQGQGDSQEDFDESNIAVQFPGFDAAKVTSCACFAGHLPIVLGILVPRLPKH